LDLEKVSERVRGEKEERREMEKRKELGGY
jgi:hypothetical protein